MKWPPLVGTASLPWWVVLRDVLLTAVAWALLLYFLRDLFWMAAYWTLAALKVHLRPRLNAGEMWRDTMPFLKIVGLLVLWLVVFSIARWRLLTNRSCSAEQPASLDIVSQAGAFGLPATTVEHLRATRVATVHPSEPAAGGVGGNLAITERAPDDR